MNRLMELSVAAVGVWALVAVAGCVAESHAVQPSSSEMPLRVLMIGNSFSISVTRELPRICKHEGRPLDLASLYIGGCSLERHCANLTNGTAGVYQYDRCAFFYRDGNPEATGSKATSTIPDALSSDRWDVVTIQQASHESWRPESYQPWADTLIAAVRRFAPTAKISVQQTWSYNRWDKRICADSQAPAPSPGSWGFDQQGMYARARTNYLALAEAHGFEVIPTGDAVENYRREVGYGVHADCVGWPRPATAAPDSWHDTIHLNDRGEYLQALVWYGKLFGVDPRTVTYRPKNVDPVEARRLANAAAEALGYALEYAPVKGVWPAGGATVELNPTNQLVMGVTTNHAQRMEMLKADREAGGRRFGEEAGNRWRKPSPFKLRWRSPASCSRSWRVEIAKDPSFADLAYIEDISRWDGKLKKVRVSPEAIWWEHELSRPNFELGRTYYWRVTGNFNCRHRSEHGRVCACTNRPPVMAMDAASFRTGVQGSRWMRLEGRVGNIRDLGGKTGLDGRRFRQGLVYRGQGLNDNSESGELRGRNRLTVEDVAYLTGTLGIRTDLDLRTDREVGGMNGVSPMGRAVRYVQESSPAYLDVFTDWGRAAMARNVREFASRANYPIYFHCIGGADRTGALAYVLLGLCGVDHDVAVRDWEETFYPWEFAELDPAQEWRQFVEMDAAIAAYGQPDEPFRIKVERYLAECGVTADEIEAIRKLLLEAAE